MAAKRACEFRSALGDFKESSVLFFWILFCILFFLFSAFEPYCCCCCCFVDCFGLWRSFGNTRLPFCICVSALCVYFSPMLFGLRSSSFLLVCSALCCVVWGTWYTKYFRLVAAVCSLVSEHAINLSSDPGQWYQQQQQQEEE